MSMNTYPFEQRAALAIDEKMACAILLHSLYQDDPDMFPEDIREEIKKGTPNWKIAENEAFRAWFLENDFFSISDAHDVLDGDNVYPSVYCSEFEGDAQCADGFEDIPGALSATGHWDDDYVCFITPEKDSNMFSTAYGSPQELIKEYEEKMAKYLGEGFLYAAHIVDVSGTYFA